jgi:hypothetical protein
LIDITPAPIFARLKRLNDRVMGRVKMFGGMLVFGGIAAANMPANQAFAQMHPAIPHLQTFFATFGARLNIVNLIGMDTGFCHDIPFPPVIEQLKQHRQAQQLSCAVC